MELIPILSFIILVATISTFLLSIGAYILYKIRESKGKLTVAPKPQNVEAEFYTPAQAVRKEIPVQQKQPVYPEPYYQKIPYEAPIKTGQYTAQPEEYQPEYRASKRKQPYLQPELQEQYGQQRQPAGEYEEEMADKKFMKYTREGYIPVDKNKVGENLKWR